MRRHTVQRHLEVEIASVLCRFRIVFGQLGRLCFQAAHTEDAAEILTYDRGLSEAFGDYVARAGKGSIDTFGPRLALQQGRAAYVQSGRGLRVACLQVPHEVRKRLEAKLAGNGGAGTALGSPGQVNIFQFGGIYAVVYARPEFGCKGAGFFYRLQDSGLTLLHLVENVHPVLHLSNGGVIHSSGFLLAVAADKRDSVALGEHIGTVLHLPDLQTEVGGNLIQVYFFHCLGRNLRKRSLMTPQKASPNIPPDILEVPSLRLMNITGTS